MIKTTIICDKCGTEFQPNATGLLNVTLGDAGGMQAINLCPKHGMAFLRSMEQYLGRPLVQHDEQMQFKFDDNAGETNES